MSANGTVTVPSARATLVDHRNRIRQLEAQRSGGGGADSVWHTVGDPGEPPFLNGWFDARQAGDTFAPVQYMIDRYGFTRLRGRLQRSTVGWTDGAIIPNLPLAFQLPVGYRPVSSPGSHGQQFFAVDTSGEIKNTAVSGSGVGHVMVDLLGNVSPMAAQTASGMTSLGWVPDPLLGGDGVALHTNEWRNATGSVFGYRGSNGFGIVAGGAIAGPEPPAALYIGTGPYADAQIQVDVQDAGYYMLGLRCQAHQFFPEARPFAPATMLRPAGYWVEYSCGSRVADDRFRIFWSDGYGDHVIHSSLTPFPLTPGISTLTFIINGYQAQVVVSPPGATVGPYDLSPRIYGSGQFGLGASGASGAGVKLLSGIKFSLSETTTVNLDQVIFATR